LSGLELAHVTQESAFGHELGFGLFGLFSFDRQDDIVITRIHDRYSDYGTVYLEFCKQRQHPFLGIGVDLAAITISQNGCISRLSDFSHQSAELDNRAGFDFISRQLRLYGFSISLISSFDRRKCLS
jgi:hypothetical protein